MTAFLLPSSQLVLRRQRAHTAVCRRHSIMKASLAQFPAILIADDIFGQIFAGAMGIIASGVIGAVFVGYLVSRNFEMVEGEVQDRSSNIPSPKNLPGIPSNPKGTDSAGTADESERLV